MNAVRSSSYVLIVPSLSSSNQVFASPNGYCGTGSQSDNTINSAHWFVIHWIVVSKNIEKVTKTVDVKKRWIDYSFGLIVYSFEWNSTDSSTKSSIQASYEHFVDTLLYGWEALTLEDSREKSRSKSRGGRLKCYICQSEDHLKRNCLKNNHKKSTGYVQKDDQPSSSGSVDDSYEVMMVMRVEVLPDRFIDSGGSYHMTPKLDLFFEFLECDGDTLLGDNRECKIRCIDKSPSTVINFRCRKQGHHEESPSKRAFY
uniref:Retrovirus-related Pol polyprotein from transposon TNT 1-94 n=1 Tax=Tanacetum cinerariifolium TaxID=118510 RepID=A0A6L2JLP1_TANCI|nr:retrovirus-related Pol polyprotein from transposon TNT 1-94 [Tanacetum cinerariifolium]